MSLRHYGPIEGFGFVTFKDNNKSQLVSKLGLILDDKQVLVPLFIFMYTHQRDQQRYKVASPGNDFNPGQAAVILLRWAVVCLLWP
ncbi:hypothetical protein BGW80DRAFT_1290409 [Lactifluus volemus]|nr:hypothetical protein BGW80DRAFT_1290409 [Lactifluus volemus]